jgi:hypothetical protein
MALTQKEATAIYCCLVRTGFAEPGEDNMESFVSKQTSGIVVVCVVPSNFYPAQFYSAERDGGRWQAYLMGATPEKLKIVQETNRELLKLWKTFQ